MNVLIYGASNVIAIGVARLLSNTGHLAVLADTKIFARAFYSKYCGEKHLFRDPLEDKSAFAEDLARCIKKEGIDFVVPTTDRALLDLVEAKGSIPSDVVLPFPSDIGKLSYVLNKGNLPEICRIADVKTPLTHKAKEGVKGFMAPLAIKRATGVAGEGFVKVECLEMFDSALRKLKKRYPVDDLLIQEYIDGKVYGAGGIFDGKQLRFFYSYEYINRYPHCGPPTMCRQQNSDAINAALEKVLAALKWHGYCQMDFIVENKTGEPYLVDINPVHWYTMPFSSSENLSCISSYLDNNNNLPAAECRPMIPYVTICLTRELQRILTGGNTNKASSGNGEGYWEHFKNLSRADFFWDPCPIFFSPMLKLLRFVWEYRR